jgi:flagellar protein FliO/FliZ
MTALQPYMSAITTGLLVLGGLILAIVLYRMLNRRIASAKGARLGVTETFDIDNDRRLVLVRRDDVEHLLLIGGEQDIVIEQSIESGLMAGSPTLPMQHHNVQPMPIRPAPRAPVFAGGRQSLRPVEPLARHPDASVEPLFPPRDPV